MRGEYKYISKVLNREPPLSTTPSNKKEGKMIQVDSGNVQSKIVWKDILEQRERKTESAVIIQV